VQEEKVLLNFWVNKPIIPFMAQPAEVQLNREIRIGSISIHAKDDPKNPVIMVTNRFIGLGLPVEKILAENWRITDPNNHSKKERSTPGVEVQVAKDGTDKDFFSVLFSPELKGLIAAYEGNLHVDPVLLKTMCTVFNLDDVAKRQMLALSYANSARNHEEWARFYGSYPLDDLNRICHETSARIDRGNERAQLLFGLRLPTAEFIQGLVAKKVGEVVPKELPI
jgi:hypothetical protein